MKLNAAFETGESDVRNCCRTASINSGQSIQNQSDIIKTWKKWNPGSKTAKRTGVTHISLPLPIRRLNWFSLSRA